MPDKPKRPAYPTEARYLIYVPARDIGIAQGAAIVGRGDADNFVVYYEEPGSYSNVVTFEDRIVHAAGRLHDRYPTSKMRGVSPDDVHQVGTVCWREGMSWIIENITDHPRLLAWDPGPHHAGGSPQRHNERLGKTISQMIDRGEFKPE